MKKFLLKTFLFTFPFIALYFFNICFWKKDGDLLRLGYFYTDESPKNITDSKFNIEKKVINFSENVNQTNYDFITIGDSFSGQGRLGYQNFLANQDYSIMNIDNQLVGNNPIQKLIELINGDFFNTFKTKYIILESVSREFNNRFNELDFAKVITVDSLSKIKLLTDIPAEENRFFSNAGFKSIIVNTCYYFMDKPFYSATIKTKLNTENLFTNNPNHLLFYEDDIKNISSKNDIEKTKISNATINKLDSTLKTLDVKLILMVAPDKYDIYYPYILNKDKYIQPTFYKSFNNLKKDYMYLDPYTILSKEIKETKDIYYYSDTHWSPIASQKIAQEIVSLIN